MFRQLRISVSIASAIVAVLLVAFWIRSYSRMDCVVAGHVGAISNQGETLFMTDPAASFPNGLSTLAVQPNYLERLKFFFNFHEALGCAILSNGTGGGLIIPHSHWVVFSGLVATTPWLPWSRRFSLGTLLIGVTLIALVLGLIRLQKS